MQSRLDHTLSPDGARLLIASDPHTVRDALRALVGSPPLDRLTVSQRGTAELVLAEVLNNIVEHAYARSTGLIDISLKARTGGIACVVVDDGSELPDGVLSAASPVSLHDRPEDLPEGGFGWSLIRGLTVELSYRRKDGRNQLSFFIPT